MQPVPKPNGTQPIHEQVIEDIKRRAEVGKQNYGTYLQANNGRDSLLDAYEEAQDKALYLKQAILERDALRAELARLQRNEDCVQRLIVWATENGWNGVDNSKILDVFISGLFDQLRAELAAAKDERDTLLADNARLRAALDRAFEGAARQLAEPRHHGNDQYALTDIATTCELALAATPAQPLAAHDAAVKVAVLREMRNKMYYAQTWDEIANMLADEADRIEKEAKNK